MILAKTVKWVVGQLRLPKLTAPCRYHLPPISQTSGPPLSPLHPPEAPLRPSPAHKWARLSIVPPYFLLQASCDASGSLACCSMSAAGPLPLMRPQPSSKVHYRNMFLGRILATCRTPPPLGEIFMELKSLVWQSQLKICTRNVLVILFIFHKWWPFFKASSLPILGYQIMIVSITGHTRNTASSGPNRLDLHLHRPDSIARKPTISRSFSTAPNLGHITTNLLCNTWNLNLQLCLGDKLYSLCHSTVRFYPAEELQRHVSSSSW